MHWLPLVAMVIASALLFLGCPLPRLVATTMEPRNKIQSSLSADYDFDNSHRDFNSSDNNTEGTPHRTADTSSLKDNTFSSFPNKESLSKQKQSQEMLVAGADLSRTEDQTNFRSQGLKSQTRKVFQDSHVPLHYKPKSGHFQEDDNFERAGTLVKKTLLKDKNNDGSKGTLLQDQGNQEMIQQLPDLLTVDTAGGVGGNTDLMPAEGLDTSLDDILQEDEELLMLASHPRVLFTTSPTPPKHPPLQLLLESDLLPKEEENEDEDGEQSSTDFDRTPLEKSSQARDGESYRNLLLGHLDNDDPSPLSPPRVSRQRRHVNLEGRERAACESVSSWVTDRKTAIDFKMQNVTVLDFFETKRGNKIAQQFYETRCRGSKSRRPTGEHGVAGGDCLGVDKKHWVSKCVTKQTYVRAVTLDSRGRTTWNWIRIDSSCVCVLNFKNHQNQWKERGTR